MTVWWSLVMAVLVIKMSEASSSPQQFCPHLRPQGIVDLDQLMGMWYAVEIVEHHHPPNKNNAAIGMDVCPVLHLARITSDHLRLLWDEQAGLLEYNFKIPVRGNPGFWLATEHQNGSLTDDRSYKQFSGTAQVMKAVGSHMVLTLCSRPENIVMSVLMSRETRLDQLEVIAVNSMLERRGLALSNIKQTCRNAAASAVTSHHQLTLALAAILSWRFGRRD